MPINYPIKNFVEINQIALNIINKFPKSKNGQPFLTLKNGRKMFFQIFIKKYGLKDEESKYKDIDVARRIRLLEFFDYFVKDFDILRKESHKNNKEDFIIESNFYRMILLNIKDKRGASKLELLSFYHYK